MTLTAAIAAFVNTLLGLVNNFGFNLSDTQRASIIAVVNAALVLGALIYDQARGIKKTALPPAPTVTPGP